MSISSFPARNSRSLANSSGAPTEELVERNVRRYYELVDKNDVPGLLELFSETAEYARPGYGLLSGKGDIRAFYSGTRVIEQGRHTLRQVVVQGDKAAVHGDFFGSLRDGREAALRFADFFTVDGDGLFRRRDTFFFAPMV